MSAGIGHLDPEGAGERCPTCGQRVGTFTSDDGTSYYIALAEQEASELEFVREQRGRFREALKLIDASKATSGQHAVDIAIAHNALREP